MLKHQDGEDVHRQTVGASVIISYLNGTNLWSLLEQELDIYGFVLLCFVS